MENNKSKSLGWGSLSLLLFIVSFIFSYLTINKKVVGEHVLEYLKLNIQVAIITVILLIFSVVLGKRFKNHLFAKSGSILSIILLSLFIIAILVGIFKSFFNFFWKVVLFYRDSLCYQNISISCEVKQRQL